MSNPTSTMISKPFTWVINCIRNTTVRLYALAIILVLVGTGYMAVVYLFRSVFQPTHVPARFLEWNAQVPVDALYGGKLGSPFARAPLTHYHGGDEFFSPDPHNDCTVSGCHYPLPHTKRKETRAFANFHATFLTCRMCHHKEITGPVQATWINTASGSPQQPPPTLQLMRLLTVEADKIMDDPAAFHSEIIELLSRALGIIGGDPLLNYLLAEINTSEPGSPVWHHAVEQLTAELPNHARGEYGAKLAPEIPEEYSADQLSEQAAQYLDAAPGSELRKQLHERIHASILEQPQACLACHGDDPARLDYESLGYAPKRAAFLQSMTVARQIQRIQDGQPFHLPRILEGGDER